MGVFDIFDQLARRMADMNMPPEAVAPMLKPSLGQTMQSAPRSPGPPQENNFSFGGLLQDLFAPMPTNESFPQAREEWNRPILPGIAPSGSQHMTSSAPAGDMMGPPMEASVFPQSQIEQGPPQSAGMAPMQGPPNLGNLMQPDITGAARPQVVGDNAFSTQAQNFMPNTLTPHAGELEVRGGTGDIRKTISDAAVRYGEDPNTLLRIAGIESSFNPKAQNPNSSAGGLFQFVDKTASGYGLKDKFDAGQSSDAAARLLRDNRAYLTQHLGREPTGGELYLAHQQGAQGAVNILKDPGKRAGDVVGDEAIKLNGGSPSMTAGDFAQIWTGKFDNYGAGGKAGDGGKSPVEQTGGTETSGTEAAPLVNPATAAPMTFGQKLGKMGENVKAPAASDVRNRLPSGTAPPPSQGSYRPDPQQLQLIMAMLGAGGSPGVPQVSPTLSQLLAVGGRR